MKIPSFDATRQIKKIRPEINAALKKVLDSGKFVMGEGVEMFETEFSSYIGTRFGIGVNSGTDALRIALRALGIGPGDEVITAANTATPTVSAIREIGATPVLVDCDEYHQIDVKKIEAAITSKTKAVIPVHLYGQSADIAAVMKIARKHKLKVVEDCAQSAGATIGNKKTGNLAHVACFSFFPTKNLGAAGDAGIILTNDRAIAEICRRLRRYGMDSAYHARIEGYNSRLQEFQAAILRVKLPHLESYNKRRQAIARRYMSKIKNPHVEMPRVKTGASHIFHQFVIKVNPRDKFLEHLKANGVGFGIHYPTPIHLQTAYGFLGYRKGAFPKAEDAAAKILSLPIFPELTEKEISYIVKTINAFKLK